jgi:hypothetical protein
VELRVARINGSSDLKTNCNRTLLSFRDGEQTCGWLALTTCVRSERQEADHRRCSRNERKMFGKHENVMRAICARSNAFFALRLLAPRNSSRINRPGPYQA